MTTINLLNKIINGLTILAIVAAYLAFSNEDFERERKQELRIHAQQKAMEEQNIIAIIQ